MFKPFILVQCVSYGFLVFKSCFWRTSKLSKYESYDVYVINVYANMVIGWLVTVII